MYDIASSKYKQLCEIRKVDGENLKVTDEGENLAEWQPKCRRMMQLCLTDGVQDVTAIEYTPLKRMTGPLLPGYKVMIIGPIVCRRGVILLEDGKYKEVGGEVDSLLKPNAPENVLARALGQPENPDPYNDNGPSKITNQNIPSATTTSNDNDNFFDDDFEEAVDLETVAAIERGQATEAVQERSGSTRNRRQTAGRETNEIMEETLRDINYEPFDDWPSDPPARPSRIETDVDDDIILIEEEASTSTRNFHSKPPPPTSAPRNQNVSDFPDDDFDFDDCDVIMKTKEPQRQQGRDPLRNKMETCPPATLTTNRNTLMEVEKCTSTRAAQNEKSMASTSKAVQQMSKTKTTLNFSEPSPAPKCDVLRDVLREPITGKMYRTVRGQVKSHSTLTKQGTCWSVEALITDHTSDVEVCFDSEILEKFLGYTVQEFLQKKKLAKSDPRINNELRLSLRKAQHEIQNLDALLKLELIQDQMPKVVNITQLTEQQKKALAKRPT
ncbi:PREDICTED: recQ-mediated genome instability protein 1-like isoform X2 [Vollenhovia emeryi]|nr:PREDICTED: recQ-mediated genome instability protein 1-like isoform X2 [Vollenhovia emeryi]